MADYTGITNKLGNLIGLPFSSFSVDEPGMIDLAFSADDLSRMNDMFWLDGIRQDSADWGNGDGAVKWANGFNLYVRPFRGHINGTIVFAPQVALTIEQETISERVDSIIIRRDYDGRRVDVVVLKGTSGSTEPPTVTYNAFGIVEYELARVYIASTMETLSQTEIADMRNHLVGNMGIMPTPQDDTKYVTVGPTGALVLTPESVKVSVADYETDNATKAPFLPKAWGSINGSGVLLESQNVTSVTRYGAGIYDVYSPAITMTCAIVTSPNRSGIAWICQEQPPVRTVGKCRLAIGTFAGGNADDGCSFIIF